MNTATTAGLALAGLMTLMCGCQRARILPPTNQPTSAPLSYANTVDQASPAVVTIHSERRLHPPQQYPFQNDPFFRWFFGRTSTNPFQGVEVEHALGSGVVVRSDGHIVTNQHVIDGAEDIRVDVSDRRTLRARLIGADALSDLAVLKVDASDLPVLTLGDSDNVRVGDISLAIGNPLGLGKTVTAGIISAKGRRTGLSNGAFEDFLQTDAAINQGNSGGALVNTAAELIGINSQIVSTNGGNIGIGFAIPSNMAKAVMEQLIKRGSVQRGSLGVTVQPVTQDLASSLGLKEAQGVLVSGVAPGGAAEKAGLRSGDVITALDGMPVGDPNTLRNKIASTPPGTQVTLTIIRNGQEQQIRATVEELKPDQSRAQGGTSPTGGRQLGITVQPVTPEIAPQLRLKPGTQGLLVQSVEPLSPAASAGIQPGDVILEANRQPVKSVEDLRQAMENSGPRPVLLLISRGGQTLFLTVNAAG